MDYMHIIALWVVFVLLIATFLIARVWMKKARIGNETDFITAFVEKKQSSIRKNDVSMSLALYFGLLFACPIVIGVGVYLMSHMAILSIICAICGILIPDLVIRILKNREKRVFEEKYGRSLEHMASSLRSGMTIIQAVKDLSENRFIYEPIRNRYKTLYANITMGMSIRDAFRAFADSTDSEDARDVALVIDIQDEVGGMESEAILSIANSIHERILLRKEVRALFSGTATMVYFMDVIPLGIVLFLSFSNNLFREYYLSGYRILIFLGICICCLAGSFINHYKLNKVVKQI